MEKDQGVALKINLSWKLTGFWVVAEGLKPSDTQVEWRKVAVQTFGVPAMRQGLILVSLP